MGQYSQKYSGDLEPKTTKDTNRAINTADKENKSSNNAYLSAKENAYPGSKNPEAIYTNANFTQNASSPSKELTDNTAQREKFVLKERNNDFVFQGFTENDEIESLKHISGHKNSSQCLSSESHSKGIIMTS